MFFKLHPAVLALYFAFVLGITLTFNNPFVSAVSLICGVIYTLVLKGRRVYKTALFSLITVAAVGVFNMLFAHYGADVLFTVGKTDFTLESLAYGLNQGAVLASSLIWFTLLGSALDSGRIIYLLRFAPKTALLFSMVLGFIPRMLEKLSDIRTARAALFGGRENTGFKQRLSEDVKCLSALVTYALESSIITARSMQARGYNPKAVRGERYRYAEQDLLITTAVLFLSVYIIIQKITGNFAFEFEPYLVSKRLSIPALISFALLALIPSAADLWENIRWKQLSSKT